MRMGGSKSALGLSYSKLYVKKKEILFLIQKFD